MRVYAERSSGVRLQASVSCAHTEGAEPSAPGETVSADVRPHLAMACLRR